MSLKKLKVLGVASMVLMLGMISVAQAGKIISIPTPSNTDTRGFGGWNLDNIEIETLKEDLVTLAAPKFDKVTGAYSNDYFTFNSKIFNGSVSGTPTQMGVLHGKDYPVGEPSGIKVINDDNAVKDPKPTNCIVTTSYLDPNFLDTNSPVQTICSSGFQTHKRFKVNMLPDSLGAAVDLVFNVEPEAGSRDYQVFQKMNNYTGARLEGFRVEVGTGVGAGFVKSSTSGLLSDLSLSAPLKDEVNGIWDPDELATFSHGLFGPADNHFPEDGYFDDIRAGFNVTAAQTSGSSDEIVSTTTLGSNYAIVPPASGPINQFGPWLHSEIAPTGVFFDDDNDPTTDAQLLAFWGDVDGTGHYHWMYGDADGFNIVTVEDENKWASSPLYYADVIEDMLNLGLNYVVTVGTVDDDWPSWDGDSATFTVRMIPIEYTGPIDEPGYVTNPAPPLGVSDEEGTVSISPKPEFQIGEPLVFYVADANTTAATISITLENKSTNETESSIGAGGLLAMTAVDGSTGLYRGELLTSDDQVTDGGVDSGTMYVEPGDLIEITYVDDNPLENEPTDETTAAGGSTFYVIPIPGGGAAVINL